MLKVRYFAPSPLIRDYVSSYYWLESDEPLRVDRLRAELGQVRFVVAGSLRHIYDDGRTTECARALLTGPTAGPVTTHARGPFRMFGAGLMPAGWSALIGIAADELADRAVDLGAVGGIHADAVGAALRNARDDAARIATVDRFFIALQEHARPVPLWYTRLTDDWLTRTRNPQVDTLMHATGMSARQVERWSNKHYGAPPKVLARKYRALQAAMRLGTGEARTWADAAADAFYDQSHFIREFKQFIGVTPAKFIADAPIGRAALARAALLPGLPKLAMFS